MSNGKHFIALVVVRGNKKKMLVSYPDVHSERRSATAERTSGFGCLHMRKVKYFHISVILRNLCKHTYCFQLLCYHELKREAITTWSFLFGFQSVYPLAV